MWSDAYFGYFTFRKRSRIRLPGKDYVERLCHANQDAYFYDYQTHSAELYDLLNHARGIPTMLQMKAVMYLSSCYLNKVPQSDLFDRGRSCYSLSRCFSPAHRWSEIV